MPISENSQHNPLLTRLREKYGDIISVPALLTLYALELDIQMSKSLVGQPVIDTKKYPLADLELFIEHYSMLESGQQWTIVRKLEALDPYQIFAYYQPTSLSEAVA